MSFSFQYRLGMPLCLFLSRPAFHLARFLSTLTDALPTMRSASDAVAAEMGQLPLQILCVLLLSLFGRSSACAFHLIDGRASKDELSGWGNGNVSISWVRDCLPAERTRRGGIPVKHTSNRLVLATRFRPACPCHTSGRHQVPCQPHVWSVLPFRAMSSMSGLSCLGAVCHGRVSCILRREGWCWWQWGGGGASVGPTDQCN